MTRARDLAPILRAPERAGLYHLPSEGLDAVSEAARKLGFASARIDLAGCTDKAGFLSRIADALHFPDWFGRNWDALADCLADLDWLPAAGYVIVLEHADRFRVTAEADFARGLEILDEAAREWSAADVPMWIFVSVDADGAARLRSL